MEAHLDDPQVILIAVQEGILSPSQILECLRERERQEAATGRPDPRSLFRIATEKGYVDPDRLEQLARKGPASGAASTAVLVEIPMQCAACGTRHVRNLHQILARPRCSRCSGLLQLCPDGPPSSPASGPFLEPPPEVRAAMENPRNFFGKYVLLAKVGAGGMGEVYKAWDLTLKRPVALKFPRSLAEEEIRRLHTEAVGAGRLRHPNIAAIHEIAEVEGRPYIAMQFIEGETAERKAEAMGNPRDFREIARWIREAALAVHYAHQNSVIHRDLKPQNLMIDPEGRVYVMDFGLAKVLSAAGNATVSGMVVGTPAFMSPEQAAGRTSEIGPASDVYALGATLYALLTGRRPHETASLTDMIVRVITTDPPPLRQIAPAVPRALEAIVTKAMEKSRERRYASAAELAADLTSFLEDRPVRARPASATVRLFRRHRRSLLTAAITGLFTLGALLTGFLLSRPSPPPPDPWPPFFAELQKVLSPDTFQEQAASLLLERLDREFPRFRPTAQEYLRGQSRLVRRLMENLPRERWVEERPRVERYRNWLSFVGEDTSVADAILRYQGSCTILIQVSPYAEVDGRFVAGLPPEERWTPLALSKVEIIDGDIILRHPRFGNHSVRASGLKDGRTYVLEGSWDRREDLVLKELP